MKEYLLKMLADGSGAPSSMRAMSFVSLFAGIALSAYGVYKGKDMTSLALLAGVFVGAAFGGKVAQASVESKN